MFSAAAVTVLTGGIAAFSVAYWNGNRFQPSAVKQDLQANQVVFPGDESKNGNAGQDNSKESELWKKEEEAESKDRPQSDKTAGYLFENDNLFLPDGSGTLSFGNNGNQAGQYPGGNGTSYDVVGDGSNADLIIGGNGNHGQGSGNTDTGNASKPGTDPNPSPDDPSTPDIPSKRPSASAKDPEGTKNNPEIGSSDWVTTKPYHEGITPGGTLEADGTHSNVYIQRPLFSDYTNMLYEGQTVTAKQIFYALETYVVGSDHVQYVWGADALDKYVKIDGISFDGGKTFLTEFPVTIPTNVGEGQMVIKAAYRFSEKGQWIEKLVNYQPEACRLLILSEQIKEENTVIDESLILNTYSQYPAVGDTENLLRMQFDLMGRENLSVLFPGWTEDGERVPWFYEVKAGRHILEPEEMVPLSEEYTVKLKNYWMSENYEVGFQYMNLCYLQTLTDYDSASLLVRAHQDMSVTGRYGADLWVPNYVQTVDFDSNADITVEDVYIPSTVLYINNMEDGLEVHKGWHVDKENEVYVSSEDGMLLNKAETEVLGVPTEIEKITISDTVTKVSLTAQNRLEEVHLKADSIETLPVINYDNLSNCTIFVKEELLEAFVKEKTELLSGDQNVTVASESEPERLYHVEKDFLIDNEGTLYKALQNGTGSTVPESAKKIWGGTFANTEITTITLPEALSDLELKQDSFADSQVQKIYCSTKAQYESMVSQLEKLGIKDIQAELLKKSKEGFFYAVTLENGVEEGTLISAPADVKSFDGTVTAEDGTQVSLTRIGDNAFAECKELEWVTLPENITEIGYQAFLDCTVLQGILIDTKECVVIGDKSVDGCTSLRFLASNAKKGIMENDYMPVISDHYGTENSPNYYFYVPTGCVGYTSTAIYFDEASGVDGYILEECGETGKCLYGTRCDENGKSIPWLALRSGVKVDDELRLPKETEFIYAYAFADTGSPSGCYAVNWNDMPNLSTLFVGCFRNSQLGEKVVLGKDYNIDDNAFAGCERLKEIEIPGDGNINLGEYVFANCENLTTVKIGGTQEFASLYSELFSGCDSLQDIYLENETPCILALYGKQPFQFNSLWLVDEEQKRLRLHVPEGAEEAYVKEWKYMFAGYYNTVDKSAYQRMWEAMEDEYLGNYWQFPTEETVVEMMRERLLEAENRLRTMLGEMSVEEPTGFYPYRITDGIYLTLIGAPSYVQEVALTGPELDLPYGATLDYVGTGAFSGSKNLSKVTVPAGTLGVYSGAFEGVESDSLTLVFEDENPLELIRTDENAFIFGADESKIHIQVPQGSENVYLESWLYPMAGYENLQQLKTQVVNELAAQNGGIVPDEADVMKEVEARLLPVYNRLRKMMGLEEKDSIDILHKEIEGQAAEIPEKILTGAEETTGNVPQGKEEPTAEDQEPEKQESEEQEPETQEPKEKALVKEKEEKTESTEEEIQE